MIDYNIINNKMNNINLEQFLSDRKYFSKIYRQSILEVEEQNIVDNT